LWVIDGIGEKTELVLASSSRADNRGNLPGALSSIIGRKREIAEVGRLLSEYRLLTLTGPGGCGKTRLALQVAEELQSEYSNGVWLVEFAALVDEALVPQALAVVLDVHEQVGRPLVESLVSHLRSRDALLLFDNCEHLIEACARLGAALLVSCPGVRLLATSREPLAIPGEGVWIVPPLSLPSRQPWRGPASPQEALFAYQRSEAVELFVVRARAAEPNFELTVENGPWVAEICRRLDGIPLAIELAAARTRAYSARQIADRLDDQFQLLISRMRTGPERHQTLEAALDWSYDLLSAKERIFLRRLAVFVGGWTLGAAEAVCAGDDIQTTEIMELLFNLVDKSLVVAARSPDGRRYHYLETVRQYACKKLVAAGEADAMRDRHLDYFVQWAEASAPHFVSDPSNLDGWPNLMPSTTTCALPSTGARLAPAKRNRGCVWRRPAVISGSCAVI
jgi:predicted ATPase